MKVDQKRLQESYQVLQNVCPNCYGALEERKQKHFCSNCKILVETCCDGAPR